MKTILKSITIGLACSTLVSKAQTFTNYTSAEGLSHDNVICLDADANDNIWFGTQEGVTYFDGTNWTVYTNLTDTGLVHNTIKAICVVANGDVWVGTDFGASRFNGTTWSSYTTANGLGDNRINHIAQDASGNIWFGDYDGVTVYDGVNWTSYTMADGLPFGGVVHTAFDTNGDKWFSTDLGGAVHYDGVTFTAYTTTNGLVANGVRAVLVDNQNNKWVGTSKGISVVDNANQWAANHTKMLILPPPDTLNPVEDLAMDSQGHIWSGVYVDYLVTEGGVAMYNGTEWIDYDVSDGLVGPVIRKLIVDGQDNVWVATSTGVSKISGATAIEEHPETAQFSMYPNPGSNNVKIDLETQEDIHVFNVIGELVHVETAVRGTINLDVSSWNRGVYLVKVGESTKKLMIN